MKLFVKPSKRNPDPEPMKVNLKVVLLIGIGLWLAALFLLLLNPGLAGANFSFWLSTCGVGIALGFIGLFIVRRD